MPEGVTQALHEAVSTERLRIVSTLIRITGDWDLAEDCVQDAIERALHHWSGEGVPRNPAAWLTTAARRRALDVLRRRQVERTKLAELQTLLQRAAPAHDQEGADVFTDDRLGLLFACCHPALPMAGRVALTLKTVAGLSTREIARAFLVSEATMGQRLLRTKAKIAHTGISLRLPEPHRMDDRVAGVLAVIYLLFNEGYSATEGADTLRNDLAEEAVRLADLVGQLLPDDGEVHGLRALLLLQHARRHARTDATGDLVTLEDQDRTRWDRAQITAGLYCLAVSRAAEGAPGYYALQAEIAATHAVADTADRTDWDRIVAVYDELLVLRPSPVIALNRAVALGARDGPDVGLEALAAVEGQAELAGYPWLVVVRADLLRRAGRTEESARSYREAIEQVRTDPERRLLRRRLQELTNSSGSG